MPDFKCSKCGKHQSQWNLDMHQKVATCKTCAPEWPDQRIVGPWLKASGLPVTPSERAE
jgi:hypothetical protein